MFSGGQPLLQEGAAALAENKELQDLIANDPELQRQLAMDPQKAMMSNPKLQEILMRDPKLQKILMNNTKSFMSDPRVQDYLKSSAQNLGQQALSGAKVSLSIFAKYVQEGPAGIQLLSCLTGVATCAVGCLNLVNMFSLLFSPFVFIENVYVLLFGAITMIVECDLNRLETLPIGEMVAPKVRAAQKCLNEEAKFLTLLWGRGLFYTFIGLLTASQCFLCLYFIIGMANVAVGILNILTHFGVETDLDYIGNHAMAIYTSIPAIPNNEAERKFTDTAAAWDRSKFKDDKLLKALHLQATKGDCQGERPGGFFNQKEKALYDAHKALTGTSQTEAKVEFVNRCNQKGLAV